MESVRPLPRLRARGLLRRDGWAVAIERSTAHRLPCAFTFAYSWGDNLPRPPGRRASGCRGAHITSDEQRRDAEGHGSRPLHAYANVNGHGPRATLASKETPAQVPRHQAARHPPPPRLHARGLLGRDGWAVAIERSTAHRLPCAYSWGDNLPRPPGRRASGCRGAHITSDEQRRDAEGHGSRPLHAYANVNGHGPRATLASRETPAQVPRHQAARHPPPPRLHARGLLGRDGWAVAIERSTAHRLPCAFTFAYSWGDNLPRPPGRRASGCRGAHITSDERRRDAEGHGSRPLHAYANVNGHGPRATLASKETPAQVPRHQAARHPPPPRLHARGLLGRDGWAVAIERSTAHRLPCAFTFAYSWGDNLPRPPGRRASGCRGAHITSDERRRDAEGHGSRPLHAYANVNGHGPRATLASRETPAQVPRHQAARHPPPPRLHARGLLRRDGWAVAIERSTAHRLPCAFTFAYSWGDNLPRPPGRRASGCRGAHITSDERRRDAEGHGSRPFHAYANVNGHGPRATLASRETPAQVPRHQAARHLPPPRLHARGLLRRDGWAAAFERSTAHRLPCATLASRETPARVPRQQPARRRPNASIGLSGSLS